MDVGTVTQLISGLGFPIACVIGLCAYIVWERKNRIAENERRDSVLKELTTTVNNNTMAIEKLLEKLK
jgi:hypothetical protein|nr:MAG TPA: YvrJ protein family protein [Caudoviricetes sp.]